MVGNLSKVLIRIGLPYPHKTDFKEVKKNYRDKDGRVII